MVTIAKRGLLLSRGREDFFDFESSLLRLKYTHVADCKPQTPPGRRWDFALELGLGLFLQYFREPGGGVASLLNPAQEQLSERNTGLNFFKSFSGVG